MGVNWVFLYQLMSVMLAMNVLAIIGIFASLQKKELAGDVLGHGVLPGMVLSFMVVGTKVFSYLALGAFCAGMLALLLVDYITYANPKIKKDTSIAVVLSSFFSLGIVLLSHVQHGDYEDQAGLEDFLMGNVTALNKQDVLVFSWLGLLVLLVVFLLFKEWRLLCFDRVFAITLGLPVHRLDFLFRCITVLAIVIGIQTVGVVFVTALLIVPVSTGYFWTNRLVVLLWVSCFFASLAGISGVCVSYYVDNMPPGPCIVLIAVTMLLLSGFFAPKRGLLAKHWKMYQFQQKVLEENLLKLLYELGYTREPSGEPQHVSSMMKHRSMPVEKMRRGMAVLCKKHLAQQLKKDVWCLTKSGCAYGRQMLERHLLWEAYLRRFLKIQDDHVHDDAEAIEHLITPEIEAKLRKILRKEDSVVDD